MSKLCRCEHIAHVDKTKSTPNGNPAHDYGPKFNDSAIVKVKTPYGTFEVCRDCANDCYRDYPTLRGNCNSIAAQVEYFQSELQRVTEQLERVLDEYPPCTSGVVIIESAIATLSELANGEVAK